MLFSGKITIYKQLSWNSAELLTPMWKQLNEM